jgi:hypothetical protein
MLPSGIVPLPEKSGNRIELQSIKGTEEGCGPDEID